MESMAILYVKSVHSAVLIAGIYEWRWKISIKSCLGSGLPTDQPLRHHNEKRADSFLAVIVLAYILHNPRTKKNHSRIVRIVTVSVLFDTIATSWLTFNIVCIVYASKLGQHSYRIVEPMTSVCLTLQSKILLYDYKEILWTTVITPLISLQSHLHFVCNCINRK